jgi:hypothetical protein
VQDDGQGSPHDVQAGRESDAAELLALRRVPALISPLD